MSMALDFTETRICVVDCGKPAPECKCRPRDLALERTAFQRMIDRQSEASREYNRNKFRIEQQD